ncbi:MAG: Dps family protein [Bacteroidia bacterium]
MKSTIGSANKNMEIIILNLTTLLASEVALYIKTRKFHMNIYENNFSEHHALFEGHYQELEKSIDEVEETVSKLGKNVIGKMSEFSKLSIILEYPDKCHTSKHMLEELLTDHEILIIELRKWINNTITDDPATTNLLTNLIKKHETMAGTLITLFEKLM